MGPVAALQMDKPGPIGLGVSSPTEVAWRRKEQFRRVILPSTATPIARYKCFRLRPQLFCAICIKKCQICREICWPAQPARNRK